MDDRVLCSSAPNLSVSADIGIKGIWNDRNVLFHLSAGLKISKNVPKNLYNERKKTEIRVYLGHFYELLFYMFLFIFVT